MKIYFNRAGIAPAIIGIFFLINQGWMYLSHKEQVFLGNSEILPFALPFFGLGLISALFRPASRKIPASLLKPRKSKLTMPPSQAFEKVKEAMNRSALQNSARGISDWQPLSEDRAQGLLQYKRIVQEYSDELTRPEILTGEMTLMICLREVAGTTEVITEYQVLSQLMTLTVIEVITETNKRIDCAGQSL